MSRAAKKTTTRANRPTDNKTIKGAPERPPASPDRAAVTAEQCPVTFVPPGVGATETVRCELHEGHQLPHAYVSFWQPTQ